VSCWPYLIASSAGWLVLASLAASLSAGRKISEIIGNPIRLTCRQPAHRLTGPHAADDQAAGVLVLDGRTPAHAME
jgi:hypothetical protein